MMDTEKFFIILLIPFFVIGTILFFIKFYSTKETSFYPLTIFLVIIIIIIVFYKRIYSFKIEGKGYLLEVRMDEKRGIEKKEKKIKDRYGEVKIVPIGEKIK